MEAFHVGCRPPRRCEGQHYYELLFRWYTEQRLYGTSTRHVFVSPPTPVRALALALAQTFV